MSHSGLLAKDLKEAQESLDKGSKVEIDFSEGTYQACITDEKTKEKIWPILQFNDHGEMIDGLCSCSSAKGSCSHLALAYLAIKSPGLPPLHIRFRHSFWNRLCQIAFARHGKESSLWKKSGVSYKIVSQAGKVLCSLSPKGDKGKEECRKLLFEREEETEETSLKFSNLSAEELSLWKAGRPSLELQYELSFWADIAKYLMKIQESKKKYQIEFIGDELPHSVAIHTQLFTLSFYVARVNWSLLIPCLRTVQSPLQVFDFQTYSLRSLSYDEQNQSLVVEREPLELLPVPNKARSQQIEVGDWLFVQGVGFFPSRLDEVFNCDRIPKEKIGDVLNRYPTIVQEYLINTQLHLQSRKVQYEIFFDAEKQMHIVSYLFEKGDLLQPGSCYFGRFIYLEKKGFYRLEQMLFEGIEKVISRDQVSDFINRHRAWLGGFEGFQTHIYQLESQLRFHFSPEGSLQFYSEIEMVEAHEELIDFGDWVYFPGKGFFSKKTKGVGSIQSGISIAKEKIGAFISLHRDELELVQGFFAAKSPLKKSGLDIFLNEEKRIVVTPSFSWSPGYDKPCPLVFGSYTYVPLEGFCEIPFDYRLPDAYVQKKVIKEADELYFVFYELELLSSHILSLQRELKKPKQLELCFKRVEKQVTEEGLDWLVEAEFVSEWGRIDLFSVWHALQGGKKYLFSPAGCIVFNNPRFNWLKTISKKQWHQGEMLRLSSLEWLRLSAFEDIEEPSLTLDFEEALREGFALKLDGFKSELRSYQEMGVKWLWSLFMQGISGLLCDEMGLGKTHQAMGLLAAVLNREVEGKVLIVCPTSVIYHWEALLQRFLPSRKVVVFYGIARSLDLIHKEAQILLTSYGTLRSESVALSEINFVLAIFDELQMAKNVRSQTHKALKKIKARMRLGLTGTPIENRLLELKAIFDLILPGYFSSEAQFKELFIAPIEKHQDPVQKNLLARLVKPFILRRKKSEVLLELPEKIEEIAYCDLSPCQKELYRKVALQHKESLITDLADETKHVPYLHIFSLLSHLKQICDHPCLINKDFTEFRKYPSGKWDLFIELLQEIRDSGQKVVIFSQYLDMLNLIQMYLEEEKIGYTGIRGSTRDRKEPLERFKNDPSCEVFLASLQAVGVGVDLVSASVVIHYDRWWNPAKENQATDRVHRMGQNRGVQVFKMVTKGTIEEHIHDLIERKKSLMEGVIGFDEQDQIKGFTRDELLSLIRLLEKDVLD